jgi:hypothetical protein
MTQDSPLCAWTGVEQDGETAVACDKAATASVRDRLGVLHYACDEHVGFVEARAGSGVKQTLSHRSGVRLTDTPEVHVVLA